MSSPPTTARARRAAGRLELLFLFGLPILSIALCASLAFLEYAKQAPLLLASDAATIAKAAR